MRYTALFGLAINASQIQYCVDALSRSYLIAFQHRNQHKIHILRFLLFILHRMWYESMSQWKSPNKKWGNKTAKSAHSNHSPYLEFSFKLNAFDAMHRAWSVMRDPQIAWIYRNTHIHQSCTTNAFDQCSRVSFVHQYLRRTNLHHNILIIIYYVSRHRRHRRHHKFIQNVQRISLIRVYRSKCFSRACLLRRICSSVMNLTSLNESILHPSSPFA